MAAPAASPQLPPGPRLPASIQTLLFIFQPRRFIAASHRRYGDLVSFSTRFDPQFVLLFNPRDIKAVFTGPPDALRAGEANALLGPVVGERSVLLLDGAEHIRHRRLMLPPFHGKKLAAHEQTFRDAADRAIDQWPIGEPFALLPWTQSLTLEVIVKAVFGVEDEERAAELRRRIRAMIEPIGNRRRLLLMVLSGGRIGSSMESFEQRRAAVDELLYEHIARRRAEGGHEDRTQPASPAEPGRPASTGDDVFSMLLAARDENGDGLTDKELRDELVTLLVAGHETTATGLAWAFERLLRTPRVLEKLKASLEEEDDDAYLDAVVKEALRLRPVIAGVGRKVRGPFELNGRTIPIGTELNPSISIVHRRPDVYPQPGEFRPERFLDSDTAPDTYSWIPFGGGVRRCLGASFALMEMREVIRRVLERTDLRPADAKDERIARRGITMSPSEGGRVIATSRR
jgi:cytochrome P450